MDPHGILWNPMKHYGFLWDSMGFYDVWHKMIVGHKAFFVYGIPLFFRFHLIENARLHALKISYQMKCLGMDKETSLNHE